jgi:Immunity protein 26
VREYAAGDFFVFPVGDDEYGSGQVMLDVFRQCVEPRRVPPDSPLAGFSGSILIDVFEQLSSTPDHTPSPRLVRGIFVDVYEITEGAWQVVGHEDVDPVAVEFPEGLIGYGGAALFRRGEIALPLPYELDELERLNVFQAMRPSSLLGNICLNYLGRAAEIDPEYVQTGTLEWSDLRYSPQRPRVYADLGEDPNQSYYEMAKRHGHDIERFYD